MKTYLFFMIICFFLSAGIKASDLYSFECRSLDKQNPIEIQISFPLGSLDSGEKTRKILIELKPETFPFYDFSILTCSLFDKKNSRVEILYHCRGVDFNGFNSLKIRTWTTSGGDHMRAVFDTSHNFTCVN